MKSDVLDHGYVRLRDHMGDDLSVVNAARVSYDKASSYRIEREPVRSDGYDPAGRWNTYKTVGKSLQDKDKRLLNFLVEGEHTSPFRHAVLQFEVYAPLMVMRQWGKYRVGSAWLFEDSDDPIETWNESSRRYVTEEPVFYIPEVWRSAPENSKQGSGEPVDDRTSLHGSYELEGVVFRGRMLYEQALASGVAPEQARLFLPAYAMYIRAIWTVSLQGVVHFLQQRLEEDSQWEIREYAKAVRDIVEPLFPESFKALGLNTESNG